MPHPLGKPDPLAARHGRISILSQISSAANVSTQCRLQFRSTPVYIEIQRLTGRDLRPIDIDRMQAVNGVIAFVADRI
jgi:hypothetical protein